MFLLVLVKTDYEINMAVNYARHALELNNYSEEEIAAKFNRELKKATRYINNSSTVAQSLIDFISDTARQLKLYYMTNFKKMLVQSLKAD
jgi:polysaccharide deacetylase 2 family uncharacterized protein YibQ